MARDDGTMVIDPSDLVRDFAAAAEKAGIDGWSRQLRDSLRLEYLLAPHSQPKLPTGYGAVYAFALSSRSGGGSSMSRRLCPQGRAGRGVEQGALPVLALPARRPPLYAREESR